MHPGGPPQNKGACIFNGVSPGGAGYPGELYDGRW